MVVAERKSKYKTKITFEPSWALGEHAKIKEWCEQTFGPGGRGKHLRWRFGWTDCCDTYYFRNQKDATMFMLRWSNVQ